MRRCIAIYGKTKRMVDCFTSTSKEQKHKKEAAKFLAEALFLIELALNRD
jgi:hypothetical protein